MFGADPLSMRGQSIDQACRAAMKIDDDIEAPQEQPSRRGILPRHDDDFAEVGIAGKAWGEAFLDQNGNSKGRELFLQRPHRRREQQTIAHRAEPD